MDKLLARIADETTVAGAIMLAREEAVARGAVATTLHIAAPHGSQVGPAVFIAAYGYAPEWLHNYYRHDVRRHDPFPDHVMRGGTTLCLADLHAKMTLGAQQKAFVEEYYADTLDRMVAIPVYGPFDFDTYATVTLGRPVTDADDETVEHMVAVVEAVNRRIAHLLETHTGLDIQLSDREREVLHWIGRSKSNGDIATILDLSAATVDTYVRRLFGKLLVNDRIAAAVKGIRLGLIRY